jgi:xylulokinase
MGVFSGLRSFTTKADMIRAIIEGLGYQFLEILNGLETGLNTRAEKIVAIGGAIKNQLWMQIKADVVGKSIEVPDIEDATPLGAAILAGIGVGIYEDEQDAYNRVYRPGRVYEPSPEVVPKYAEGFKIYRQLYPALKQVHWSIFDSTSK